MRWQTKSCIQRQISKLPSANRLYFQGQKRFGGFRRFSINSKIDQGIALLSAMSANSVSIRDKHIAEIGTGWVPIVPMLFTLLGAEDCVTCDVNSLLDQKLIRQAFEQFRNIRLSLNERLLRFPEDYSLSEIDITGNLNDADLLLQALNITCFVGPQNPLKEIKTASIDVFFSNDTLEHIPSGQIPRLFSEIHRVLKPDGLMIHQVDCSDHYSHSDPSINRINFLRFNAKQWASHNNYFLFQNRLRPSEYREMIRSNGFSIDYWDQKLNQSLLAELPCFPLAKEFQSFSSEDICVSDFIVLARPILHDD